MMTAITKDNPHTVRKATHELVYWTDSTASGAVGADYVEVFQYIEGQDRYTVGAFVLPQDASKLERIEGVLERAFEFGRYDKARELQKALCL